jgi:hypothetical protein
MAELVDALVAKGYLERVPDPADGRAELLVMATRGAASHEVTLRIFAGVDPVVPSWRWDARARRSPLRLSGPRPAGRCCRRPG